MIKDFIIIKFLLIKKKIVCLQKLIILLEFEISFNARITYSSYALLCTSVKITYIFILLQKYVDKTLTTNVLDFNNNFFKVFISFNHLTRFLVLNSKYN